MTLAEWDQDIEAATTEELERRQKALIELQRWVAFNVEFKWTSMFTLLTSIEYELRKRDANRTPHTAFPHIFAECPACQEAWKGATSA